MKQTIVYSLAACLVVLMMVASPVEASAMSGTVKFAGSGLGGAKVTIESPGTPGNYFSQISAADGTWSFNPPSGTYTVDAMKDSFTHVQQTGIGSAQTGIIHTLNTRSDVTAKFKIAGDEEFRTAFGASWQTTAKNKLFYAEPWFRDEHAITFADVAYFTTWNSNNNPTDCGSMITEAMSQSGWSGGTYSGASVLALFTGQNIPAPGGGTVNGCVSAIPTQGGTHPGLLIRGTGIQDDTATWVMHEITHLYGFSHTFTCTNVVPAIMNTDASSFSCSSQIKNWQPSDDLTLENRRTWY